MSGIVWEEPPAARRRASSDDDARALIAHPGRWARLSTYTNRSTAYSIANRIKNGAARKWQPAGAFEVVVRSSEDAWTVYARYVGEGGAR